MSDFSNQPQGYAPPTMGYMPPQDPYALRVGFGKRLGAYVLDFVFLIIISVVTPLVLGMQQPPPSADMDPSMMMDLIMSGMQMQLPAYLIMLAYMLVEAVTGASIGKHILRIVVAHDDRQQGAISLFTVRWAIKNLSFIIFLLGVIMGSMIVVFISLLPSLIFFIGCFFALGEKKQALHDMLAKTAIFHKTDVISDDATAAQVA